MAVPACTADVEGSLSLRYPCFASAKRLSSTNCTSRLDLLPVGFAADAYPADLEPHRPNQPHGIATGGRSTSWSLIRPSRPVDAGPKAA